MNKMTITVAAAQYGADRFTHDAFAKQIGKTIPIVDAQGSTATDGLLLSAEVDPDGTRASLTFEVLHHGASARGFRQMDFRKNP